MIELPANITISKPSCNTGEQFVSIEIIDDVSNCQVCELKIPLDDFAKVITGLSRVHCLMEFNDKAPVGKQLEHKTEKVIIKGAHRYEKKKFDEAVEKALKPFEKQGWKGCRSDAGNPHRGQPDTGVSVSFHRHVDADPEKVEKQVKKIKRKILPPEHVQEWMHNMDDLDKGE